MIYPLKQLKDVSSIEITFHKDSHTTLKKVEITNKKEIEEFLNAFSFQYRSKHSDSMMKAIPRITIIIKSKNKDYNIGLWSSLNKKIKVKGAAIDELNYYMASEKLNVILTKYLEKIL